MHSWIDWLNHPVLTLWGSTMSAAEVFGFATGLWAVWLTARGSIWNFPIGIANAALLLLLFFDGRLFADASLQIMFILLGFSGWWFWARKRDVPPLAIRAATTIERIVILLATAFITAVLYLVLTRIKGSVPIFDALITATSIVAQWLLNRKILENWILWITVDIISVPVYLFKHFYLIALLSTFFLALALRGYQLWRRELIASKTPLPSQPILAVSQVSR